MFFDQMDSRDVKSLLGPLGIPHPPMGNRQTAEYNRIIMEWIDQEPESRWKSVQSLINMQRSRPGGLASAQDRAKKRAARLAISAPNEFITCVWSDQKQRMVTNNNFSQLGCLRNFAPVQNIVVSRPCDPGATAPQAKLISLVPLHHKAPQDSLHHKASHAESYYMNSQTRGGEQEEHSVEIDLTTGAAKVVHKKQKVVHDQKVVQISAQLSAQIAPSKLESTTKISSVQRSDKDSAEKQFRYQFVPVHNTPYQQSQPLPSACGTFQLSSWVNQVIKSRSCAAPQFVPAVRASRKRSFELDEAGEISLISQIQSCR